MAKFKPISVLKTLSGKVCSHSNQYFANKKETKYTGTICNPRTKPYTADELSRQERFRQARAATLALTPEQITAYRTAFLTQRKYHYLQGYIFAQEYAKLVPQGGGQ